MFKFQNQTFRQQVYLLFPAELEWQIKYIITPYPCRQGMQCVKRKDDFGPALWKKIRLLGILHCDPWTMCWDVGRWLEKVENIELVGGKGDICNSWRKMNFFCREKQLSYNSLSLSINPSASRTSVGDIWERYFKICLSLPIWRFAQAREPQQIMMETSKFYYVYAEPQSHRN